MVTSGNVALVGALLVATVCNPQPSARASRGMGPARDLPPTWSGAQTMPLNGLTSPGVLCGQSLKASDDIARAGAFGLSSPGCEPLNICASCQSVSPRYPIDEQQKDWVLCMKWVIGDYLLGLTSNTGGTVQTTEQLLAEKNGVSSELYFAKSQRHVIDTADKGQFAAKEVTVIYLSFTNVRVSIALPGGGVSLHGGACRTDGRSNPRPRSAVSASKRSINRNSRAR
jgi:hypothetical protein